MEKLLVFINPISGNGKSIQKFNHIESFLNQKYKFIKFKSKLKNYCSCILNKLKLDNYKNLIVVGGDGFLNEIINFIIANNIDISIGIVPTGSGNGIFQSIVYQKKQLFNLTNCVSIINKPVLQLFDVMKVTYDNKTIYSILAIGWGIISEIDIKTEWLRCLGSLRFDLGAIWNIIKKPVFRGRLIYLSESEKKIKIISGNFCYFWACNVSHSSYNVHSAPGTLCDDGYISISYIKYPVSRCDLIKIMLQLSSGSFITNSNVGYIRSKYFRLEKENGIITLDGEVLQTNKIEVSILSKKIKIMT